MGNRFGERRKQEVQTTVLVQGWRVGKLPGTKDMKRKGWL